MKPLRLASLALSGCLIAAPAVAKPASQPPMNDFDFAYYTCENGAAFQMTYDGSDATSAVMTTSDNNAQHALKRTPVNDGVQFSDGKVTFWTDGSSTVVKGTQIPMTKCRMK